jgi:ketosteroid isomerase-like protein
MSAALELVKIALHAYGSGDPEITIQLCDPLIRWDERASRPDGELVWGQENVIRAMRDYLNAWEEYRFEVEKIAEVGPGRIVGLCRERGREVDGGVSIDRHYGGLWVVEANKIASWATYLTPKEAVRAAKELAPNRFVPEQDGSRQPAEQVVAAKGAAPPGRPRMKTSPVAKPAPAAAKPPAPADFSQEQRKAAKRRAALARAAREGGRRAPTG